MKMKSYKSFLIAFFLAFTHFTIGWSALENKSLNLDEAYSVYHAQQDKQQFIKIFEKEANPPLYFHLLHQWIKIFGTSERAIRSLSWLFQSFLIGIACFFFLIKQGFCQGVLVALALAFSSSLVHYGGIARPYSLATLFSMISILLLIENMNRSRLSITLLHALFLSLSSTSALCNYRIGFCTDF